MKHAFKILGGLISLMGVGLFLLWPMPSRSSTMPQRSFQQVNPEAETGYNVQNTLLGQTLNNITARIPNQQTPIVGEPVTPGLSPAVRDLPVVQGAEPVLDREINPRQNPAILKIDPNNPDPYDTGEPDPLVQRSHNRLARTPAIITSFEGIGLSSGGGGIPPDTVGDVGPNHYVQMVNSAFRIFDKAGGSLAGPTNINQLWTGQGNDCASENDGDPVVLYDPLADHWLLSQFVGAFDPGAIDGLCIAVSQTADPTGAYYLYEFNTGDFPDYYKIGVWPDAYYISANESTYTAYAFDRTNMVAGNPARPFVKFTNQTNLLLPADLDGATAPPVNSPGYFYTFKDNSFHGGSDRLEVFEFDVDFDTPANSTFTLVDTIALAAFTYTVCGFFNLNCIP